MTLTTRAPRRTLILALLAVMFSALYAVGSAPSYAEPNDSEGASAKLRKALDEASRGYLDAKVALDRSVKRQAELTTQLTKLEADHEIKVAQVREMASAAYRAGRLSTASALLGAESPDDFVNRVFTLNMVTANDDGTLRDMVRAQDRVTAAKATLAEEIDQQKKQVAIMAARKKQAEDALTAAGYGKATSGVTGLVKWAKPAPRNPDGSWPAETCSVDDPTTSGCITPRTLHALQEAKAAGFTHYVSCYRVDDHGEHPKGRACDFAAAKDGFGGAATGADRTYGNNLAAFFVRNADRLGVLYVIWYRQIWLPSSGWRSYSGSGSPAAEHTNHVHLSEY
jgi:peptidoglycan DL-endopeptidase CwlO